ncbi:MAG: hypothetical protein A3J69_01250 [Candidatus Levybacteria bacterium RIFCSPHIGHO2_02_FULL_42_12]|nr:MAG: hypothetical protein A3J69_01250 [Candidatus Levybacteria bacterium RIFCSPHIGHO2_02_FULL_42_12]OGH42923.1 MAG: hypothetical protein A3B53_00245 [Candidatus Levybacteria bacterium RIFCSPLOWO2_01_FULL_42_15]
MKDLLIVANWKSYKTTSEAKDWIERFNIQDARFINKKVVLCAPFTLLSVLKSYLVNHKSSIMLGAQDISPFGEGAYTGEVNGKQLKEFASRVLIGHSERRKYCGETNELLAKKVDQANLHGIFPIYCAQGSDTPIPKGVEIVAYEPVFAIGTGKPDTPQSAEEVALFLKENSGIQTVLYGGSVTPKNVHSFTVMPHIDGVLVGSSSLDPALFRDLIHHA